MDANLVKVDPKPGGMAKLFATVAHVFGWDAQGEKQRAKSKAFAAIVEAEARRDVARINAETDLAVSTYIWERGLMKRRNSQSVVMAAARHLSEGEIVSDEAVNSDWVNRFLDIVEGISEDSLRELWGRILAGEVKHPHSYSLRTLDVLRNVTKEEAELFARSMSYRVKVDYVWTDESVLDFHEVLLLAESGFLSSEDLAEEIEVEPHSEQEVVLDRETLLLLVNNTENVINCSLDIKKISTAGKEVLPITTTKESDKEEFYAKLATYLKQQGISKVFKHRILDYDNDILYHPDGVEIM